MTQKYSLICECLKSKFSMVRMKKSNAYVYPKEGSKVHKAKYHNYEKKILITIIQRNYETDYTPRYFNDACC